MGEIPGRDGDTGGSCSGFQTGVTHTHAHTAVIALYPSTSVASIKLCYSVFSAASSWIPDWDESRSC